LIRSALRFGLSPKKAIKLAAVILAFVSVAYAFAEGPDQGYTGAPGDFGDCTACHDTFAVANVGPGSVALGQTPNVYQPGQSYNLTVSLQDPQARRWGFELTGLDGQGNRVGTFAPLGNAANDDGTDQGDYIYTNGVTIESPSTLVTLGLVSNPQGTTLDAGSTYTISWSATNSNNVASYEVRYSTDNGATFPITNLIFSTTDASDTSTQWVVPDTPTGAARIRVLASTDSGSVVTVISGAFTIQGSGGVQLPLIESAHNVGNKLIVVGQNFEAGAVVTVNAQPVFTVNKTDFSHKLACKKGLKGIQTGTAVTLTVTNPDGGISSPFLFTRPST